MFLKQTLKKNSALIEAAFALHRNGTIQPDSYLVDVDTFLLNAGYILEEAKKYGIKLFFMLKQVGRNPYLAKKLTEMGYAGAVCVDYREARVMMQAGVPIGNVGHLVQIPAAQIDKMVAYGPQLITVYSYEKIMAIQDSCSRQRLTQDILLRVNGPEDDIYSGQAVGFLLKELPELIRKVKSDCRNVHIKGVTSFPCFLYDESIDDVRATNNLVTVKKAVELLKAGGIAADVINTPSATCTYTMKMIHQHGGNCGEPGHGFTGTTPMHAVHEQIEQPAVVYVSEVSHTFMGKAYCYGGGHYRRSHVKNVLIGYSPEEARLLEVIPPEPEAIDYHLGISEECRVGETAVMAFRFQMFVCRSDVVLVKGIRSGGIEIIGTYDCAGRIRA